MIAKLKRLVKRMAPLGTRRRNFLRAVYWFAVRWRRPHRRLSGFFLGPLPTRIDDVYDRKLLNHFLAHMGERPLLAANRYRIATETDAVRFILSSLMERPELRKRFPRALSDGPVGGFCQLLCSEAGADASRSTLIREAFARRFGARVMQGYDEFPDWRAAFPLALTPMGRANFLRFLLVTATQLYTITVEEVLWFHLANAEDMHGGIVATYLRSPAWQERVPHGLTRVGWAKLCAFLAEGHGFDADWLATLPEPHIHNREEEARLHALAEPHVPQPQGEPGVNVLGHFRYACGLGEAAYNTIRALELTGVAHSKRDVPAGMRHDEPDRTGFLGLEPYDTSVILMAPEPLVDVCYPLAGLWKRPGTYRVAVWYWELESVPAEWKRHADLLSEIWAPTRFIHDAMKKVMPIPVLPMLPGMQPPRADDLPKSHFGLRDDCFTFLFMFDMNSVMERKNPLGLIAAFREAFPKSSDVQLAIKVSRGRENPTDFARLQAACAEAGGSVVLIDQVMPRAEAYALTKSCDCYVSLHRSEGYGLTMAEAMFFAKPTIATGYSGNVDFMSADTSVMLPYRLVPLDRDYAVYPKGALWAEPSHEAAVEALRTIFAKPVEAKAMGERGKQYVSEVLSLEAYGRRMQKRLAEIEALRREPLRKSA